MSPSGSLISKLSENSKWGKVFGSIFGFIEVPLLEGVKTIDKYLVQGFYDSFMKYFALFYGSRVIPLTININTTHTFLLLKKSLKLFKGCLLLHLVIAIVGQLKGRRSQKQRVVHMMFGRAFILAQRRN